MSSPGVVRQVTRVVPYHVLSVRVHRHLGIRARFVPGVQTAREGEETADRYAGSGIL